MRGKLLFVAGLAAGYVIGARAGRPAYDAIAERVQGAAASPEVQEVGRKAKETLEEKAPRVAAVAEQVAGTAAGAAEAAAKASTPEEDAPGSDDSDVAEGDAEDVASQGGDDAGSPPKPGPPATPGASTRGTASPGTPAA